MKAFRKHFSYLTEQYGKVLMVNLLKEKSEREELLSSNVKFILERRINLSLAILLIITLTSIPMGLKI